jgi:endonuclease/exonuclease/phosphatase family metal-dependent hydrolase
MKILQLNTWGGRLQRQVINLLIKEQPDVVCLQEVIRVHKGDDNLFFGTLREILEQLPDYKSYFSPVFGIPFMGTQADFGNCILTKLAMTKQETIFTNKQYVSNFNFDDYDYNVRNLQHVIVTTPNGPLHVLNHHGHHVAAHKDGDDQTFRQTKQIADYIRSLKGNVLLTGDFNLSPHSESLEQINDILENQCLKHPVTTTRNQFTPKTEVCDYIFTNKEMTVSNFKILPDLVSDHMALVANLCLQ